MSKPGLTLDPKKVQHEYKHAADYGITGPWNNANKTAFEQAIRSQVNSINPILGTYRGTITVYHFFDPRTGLDTMVDLAGNFVGGWKLGAEQILNLLRSGNVR